MNARLALVEKPALAAQSTRTGPCCRFCAAPLVRTFVDLGLSPLCESYVPAERLNQPEAFYPLHVYVCESCFLVQLEEYVAAEDIFTEYAYFSSYSDSWVEHMRRYADMACERFGLGAGSLVLEVASNDGYLLQHFVRRGVPVLGIEPAANVAAVALAKGIPTLVKFFGRELARELAAQGKQADLVCGANVLAQVPDLNDFVAGLQIVLKPDGVLTLEFPHLLRLMAENQFDTIYHEHFSYFSFTTAQRIFAAHGLTLFDVEKLPTHGGSLRIYACRAGARPVGAAVPALAREEADAGLLDIAAYAGFDERVRHTKRKLLEFLLEAKRAGKTVAGYGAPGKGNTLLNYCGIRTDFIEFTVDRNPYKQGKFLPGTRIPIYAPEKIREAKPDYVLILPWNFKDEIVEQLAYIRQWGGKLVVPIPEVRVLEEPRAEVQSALRFTPTRIAGVWLVEQQRRADARGFFARTWCQREFAERGLEARLAQCSTAFNERRGTLRGLHYQAPPNAEVKLVRCTRGGIFDVAVDLRPDSPTFRCWIGVYLSAEDGRALYLPRGCAHGFLTLADSTEVSYQMSEFYAPDMARGIRWNDPYFGVQWPAPIAVIAARDADYADADLARLQELRGLL